MTAVKIELKGGRELAASAADAAQKIAELDAGYSEAATVLASSSSGTAPRLTGRLAGSVASSRGPKGSGLVTSPLVYAVPIHWGSVRHSIEANPFIMRAAQRSESQWLAPIERDAQRVCDGVRGA